VFETRVSTVNLLKVQCGPKFPAGYIQLSSSVSVEFDAGCIAVGLDGWSACTGFVTGLTHARPPVAAQPVQVLSQSGAAAPPVARQQPLGVDHGEFVT
jgi:hypothetical protein